MYFGHNVRISLIENTEFHGRMQEFLLPTDVCTQAGAEYADNAEFRSKNSRISVKKFAIGQALNFPTLNFKLCTLNFKL